LSSMVMLTSESFVPFRTGRGQSECEANANATKRRAEFLRIFAQWGRSAVRRRPAATDTVFYFKIVYSK
jgi:hypothetical protein